MAILGNCARVGLALALALGLTTGVRALPAVQAMFVFGDSLSDSGNAAALTINPVTQVSFFPPGDPSIVPGFVLPYSYRFSNGPVAVEYLSSLLGIAPSLPAWAGAPSNANSNFAVGGGMTGPQPVTPLPFDCCNFNWIVNSPAGLQANFPQVRLTGVNNQIERFVQGIGAGDIAFDPATTLFTVWAGPNDVFLALALAQLQGLDPVATAQLVQLYAATAVSNLAQSLGALAALGAERFLVLNMPNLGATPFALANGIETALTAVSAGFNAGLGGVLGFLRSTGLDILEFDTFAALDALIASGTFGNVASPCFDSGQIPASLARILGGCQDYLWFDGVHPTTAVHAILAQQLARVVPEPVPLALLAAVVLALAWVRRRKRQGA
jgi:phospholipase/lecithinase/hemolysin